MDKRVLHHQRALLLSNPEYLAVHQAELEQRRKNKAKKAARDAKRVGEEVMGERKGKRGRSKGQGRGSVRKKRGTGSAPSQEQEDSKSVQIESLLAPAEHRPDTLIPSAANDAHVPTCHICSLMALPQASPGLNVAVTLGKRCPHCQIWWCGLCRYDPRAFQHEAQCK